MTNDRFAGDLWQRAESIARRYQIILDPLPDAWHGRALELPSVSADGATADECIGNVRRALTEAVAVMLRRGQVPPAPAREVRTCQTNVRLSADERLQLEAAAKRLGFSTMAAFIRWAALSAVTADGTRTTGRFAGAEDAQDKPKRSSGKRRASSKR